MADIIVESRLEVPLQADYGLGSGPSAGHCFDTYRVYCHDVYLANDGRRLLSHFSAPDAESARVAFRQLGVKFDGLWTATVHDAERPALANVIVERSFEAPVTMRRLETLAQEGTALLADHSIRPVRTFLALNRKRMICLYQAGDLSALGAAQRALDLPFDRIWNFRRLGVCPLVEVLACVNLGVG